MSLGHAYSAIFRVTPIAGPVYTIDVSDYSHIVTAQPSYEQIIGEKEFIDRSVGLTRYGFRCSVAMEFQFPTPSSDETEFTTYVVNPAMQDLATVELSLDGGTVYREVVLMDFRQEPLSGKNIGLMQAMTWVCSDVLSEKPTIGTGSW